MLRRTSAEEDEAGLAALLQFIRGEVPPWTPGMRSFPGDDPATAGKHQACLELERRGALYRHWEDARMIVWKPVEDALCQSTRGTERSPSMSDVITWAYFPDEGYYIDTAASPLDQHLMALVESGIPLPLPKSADNDADMQLIVDALRRIAARLASTPM